MIRPPAYPADRTHRGHVPGFGQLRPHAAGSIRPDRPGGLGVPSTSASGAVRLLGCGGLIQLADRHDGRLSGIVSIGDIVKHRLEELQSERDHLTAYITG